MIWVRIIVAVLLFIFFLGAVWILRPRADHSDHSIRTLDRTELQRELDTQ
jgi:hypothetical protein